MFLQIDTVFKDHLKVQMYHQLTGQKLEKKISFFLTLIYLKFLDIYSNFWTQHWSWKTSLLLPHNAIKSGFRNLQQAYNINP